MLILRSSCSSLPLSTYNDGFIELVYPPSCYLCDPLMISKSALILSSLYLFPLCCFLLHACLQSFDSTLNSSKERLYEMSSLPEIFQHSVSHSENSILDQGHKLLWLHIVGPVYYPSISNKEAWWRQRKECYFTTGIWCRMRQSKYSAHVHQPCAGYRHEI
jgi:hypothetical protein